MAKKYIFLIGVVIVLLGVRLALPYGSVYYINKALAGMDGYYGHIESVKLSLYRGAYVLERIYLNKIDPRTKKQTLFFTVRDIDLSIEWKALFHGAIVGKLTLRAPELIFTKDKVELGEVRQAATDYRKLFNDLMPLRINRLEVVDGAIHYTDNASTPKVDVSLKKIDALAFNLSNVTSKNTELPSRASARAEVYEGTMDLTMRLNALAEKPTFELTLELKNTNLALLNGFLKAYGHFDVHSGNFGLYAAAAAKDGRFAGSVKPVITGLKVLGPQNKNDTVFQKAWETVVAGTAAVFKNMNKDQLATKFSIEGSFNDPRTDILEAFWEVLQNAFIKALVPRIDNEIKISSVKPADHKNILQKIISPHK
jgi:hypothetical protein